MNHTAIKQKICCSKSIFKIPVATGIIFKISNTYSEWAKAFDEDRPNQESAGIKSISLAVNETDSSTVMVILEAEPKVLTEYMEGNLNVEASGCILGSEEFSNWLA